MSNAALKLVPSIGCDPEVFVKVDGKFINPCELTKGTKENPEKLDKGAVQIDGMALEFNITPAKSLSEFFGNIKQVTTQLNSIVAKRYGDKGSLWSVPVADFDEEYLFSQPKENLELGCNADYNAYTGEINPRPDAKRAFRTGAGHVHVGWANQGGEFDLNDPEHFEACQMMVKQLDCSLGIPFAMFEKDTRRRSMYGNFGAFRPKPYGVEYRTLSNTWLLNERLISCVFNGTNSSFNDLMNGKQYYDNQLFNNVMALINSHDIWNDESRKLIVDMYAKACKQIGISNNISYLQSIQTIMNESKKG